MRVVYLLLLVAVASASAMTWQTETVDSEGDVGNSCRIAIDSENNVHVIYMDDTNNALKHARRDGIIWSVETVPTSGTVWSPFLALDADGYPCVSYFEPDDDVLYYVHWTGSTWSTSAVATVDNQYGVRHSLAIDSDNRPHLLYENNDNLWYAISDGASWEIETVFDSYYPYSLDPGIALVLDSYDNPHFLYEVTRYDFEMVRYLRYGYGVGSSWGYRTIHACNDGYYYQSLAIGGDDALHAAYSAEENTDNRLYYAYSSGGYNWDVIELADEAPASISVSVDPSGDPRISYSVDDLMFAYLHQGTWYFETVDTTHDNSSQDMALDSSGNPFITFCTGDYWDQDLMMAYSYTLSIESSGSTPGIGLSLPVNPVGPVLTAYLSLQEPMYVRVDLYDLSGRRVRTLENGAMYSGENVLQWDVGGCSKGLHIVRLTTPLGAAARSCMIL